MGRKSIYTEDLADKICDGLASGNSLTKVCKQLKIGYSTVDSWLTQEGKKDFLEKYKRARDSQADYLAEEIIDIADNEKISSDSRRIRVDVRKWYAGKVRPKKYGDKTMLSGDAENPLIPKKQLSRKEIARIMVSVILAAKRNNSTQE